MLEVLRYEEKKLCAKLKKCEFGLKQVASLWYIIYENGASVDPKKIQAIMEWSRPTIILEIQSFIGFAENYGRFVQDFSRISMPITRLVKNQLSLNGVRSFSRVEEASCLLSCFHPHFRYRRIICGIQ